MRTNFFEEDTDEKKDELKDWFKKTVFETAAITGSLFLIRAAERLASAGLRKIDTLFNVALPKNANEKANSTSSYSIPVTDSKGNLYSMDTRF